MCIFPFLGMEGDEITDKTALQALSNLVSQCETLLGRADPSDPNRVQFAGFLEAAKRQFTRHISSITKEQSSNTETERLAAKSETVASLGHEMDQFQYKPIGYLESVFSELNGCPRQGTLAPHSRGRIKIRKDLDPKNALRGMTDYSHVWLLFVFHRNTNTKYHPVVAPPKLGGAKLGVFATRTPHRPCNIGLTVASIESVDGDTLTLTGVDLVDGTPILDIKPYVPADVIQDPKVPGWVAGGGKPAVEQISRVNFSEEAREQLRKAMPSLKFYRTEEEALKAIEEILLLDIRTTHMKEKHSRKVYGVCIDTVNVVFEVVGGKSDDTEGESPAQEILVLKVEEIPQKNKRRRQSGLYDDSSSTKS
jgi:tRNA-Thr(GGU) m(6)t(6)A37 methyltransferase TsaA